MIALDASPARAAYQRANNLPPIAPSAASSAIANVYQVATNSGELSVQWAA